MPSSRIRATALCLVAVSFLVLGAVRPIGASELYRPDPGPYAIGVPNGIGTRLGLSHFLADYDSHSSN